MTKWLAWICLIPAALLLGSSFRPGGKARFFAPLGIRSDSSRPGVAPVLFSSHQAASFDSSASAREEAWVDSVDGSLSRDEKIGQFFMVATFSDKDELFYSRIETLVRQQHVGGLIFFKGDPNTQVQLTNRFQAAAKTPLMVALDAEIGLGMRLDSAMKFPKQMTLGAIRDNQLIFEMGQEIARQCKRIGVHLNFAPVVDVNSNPRNPAIGNRSFGELKENVAAKGSAYMKGMQTEGVLACAKHFPGHGDTENDSHHTLPLLHHSGDRLRNLELYPFRRLIADSVSTIIVAHLSVPYYEQRPIAATLSDKIVVDLLKNEMGFRGLVITDAMNMRGVRNGGTPAEANLQALLAGNDILLYPESVAQSIQKIKEAAQRGLISWEEIDARVRKILRAKYRLGLAQTKPISLQNLHRDIWVPSAQVLMQKLYEQAITVVRNDGRLLPLARPDTLHFASVAIGEAPNNVFQQTLSRYARFRHFTNDLNCSELDWYSDVLAEVDSGKTVVVSLHETNPRATIGTRIPDSALRFIAQLKKRNRVIVCVFGSPYTLKPLSDVPTLVCGFEDNPLAQSALAQILFGALPARGRLPVTVEGLCRAGAGFEYEALGRLGLGLPESVGMRSEKLSEMDNVIRAAIQAHAFPGCQVLVARRGRVVYQKNYGSLSYDYTYDPVRDETVYDLASVTKVAATLQALMALTDQKLLDINQKASAYLPELRGTNKENILIRDLLLHQAGLPAFLPFWERTRSRTAFDPGYFRRQDTLDYRLAVAPGLYTRPATRDSVWRWIIRSPLLNKRDKTGPYEYVYSDLGLMMLQHVAEALLKEPLDAYLTRQFYGPLGMARTGFNPLTRLPAADIAPTERDYLFREAYLRGTVQDQNAALQGGVSGHAGLFSTASDLAILLQMNLQKGSYGGRQFLQQATVQQFTKQQTPRNYRGLGWDRRPADGESSYVSAAASAASFGHSGYTGTLVWVDPDQDLLFVFLSNRVNPDASNALINTQRIRRKVMDAVYAALEK